MSKQKRKKLTFWSKYKMPIIAIVAFSAIVYVIIYLVFKENGIFPVGTGLEKSDWLSFLGAYLSFIGTVIVSLIAIFQSIYYSELNERKDAENRKKEIQPIFSVKIVSIDMQLDGTAEAFSLYDKATNPIHKNVKISVENVNRFPIKHMIVFDKYITPLLKCNEIQYVHCAYYDSVDAKKWPKQIRLSGSIRLCIVVFVAASLFDPDCQAGDVFCLNTNQDPIVSHLKPRRDPFSVYLHFHSCSAGEKTVVVI